MTKSKVPVDVRWIYPLPSTPSMVTLSQDAAGLYFVSYICESELVQQSFSPKMVGIHARLTILFATGTGSKEKLSPPCR